MKSSLQNQSKAVFCLATSFIITLAYCDFCSAQLINFEISGNYDTGTGPPVFGQSGSSIAYSYSMIYDTTLDTNNNYFAVGDTLGSRMTTHEWHGYSRSGIISSLFTFGTKTFTVADIQASTVEPGVSADFWLDNDFSDGSSPNEALIYFSDFGAMPGILEVSAIESTVQDIFISSYTRIFDFTTGGSSTRDFGVNFAAVPEPTSLMMMALFTTGLLCRRRRSAS